MKYTIEVTQADIDAGESQSCTACPIALAVQRVFPECRIEVTERAMYLYRGEELEARANTPRTAARFVRLFDQGFPVEPFTFEVDPA